MNAPECIASPGAAHTNSAAAPLLSIVIVSYNSRAHLGACLRSLRQARIPKTRTNACEIIVVDNASPDNTADWVAEHAPDVRLIRSPVNRGFAAGCNLGIKAAHPRSEHVLLLNPDTRVAPEALARTLRYLQHNPSVGILGGRLLDPDGSVQPSARRLPGAVRKLAMLSGLSARFPFEPAFADVDHGRQTAGISGPVDWVVGAFFCMRREMLAQTGLLDEDYFLYFEEIDLCRAARRHGYSVHYLHEAVITHIGGASARTTDGAVSNAGSQLLRFRTESELRYYRKNDSLIKALAIATLHIGWHGLVAVRNRLRGNTARASEAFAEVRSMWAAVRALKRAGKSRSHPETGDANTAPHAQAASGDQVASATAA